MYFSGNIVREYREYDFWFGYSDSALTKLCASFNLPTNGTKKEKAARLCFAWELGYEAKGDNEEAKIVEAEYNAKLNLADFSIPDPNKLENQLWKSGPPRSIFERRNIVDYFLRNPFLCEQEITDLNK